jgi:hypothetical protein
MVLCGALLSICIVVPVDAGPGGPFVYVQATADAEPSLPTTVSQFCASGSRATGVGASINIGYLKRAEPFDLAVFDPDTDQDDGSTVQMVGGDGATKVKAFAICLKGELANSLAYARQTSAAPIGSYNTASSISCDAGSELIGGGAGIDPTDNDRLSSSFPNETDDWFYAIGAIGASQSREASAVSVCIPTGMVTITRRAKTTTIQPQQTKRVSVLCGPSAHVASGGMTSGFFLNGITASRPIDGPDADRVTDDGWSGKVRNLFSDAVDVTVSAVCVK